MQIYSLFPDVRRAIKFDYKTFKPQRRQIKELFMKASTLFLWTGGHLDSSQNTVASSIVWE